MSDEDRENLGPLAPLLGVWEGDAGVDTAPSAERGTAVSRFRERTVFEPTGRIDNHEQTLYGLRYFTEAWRLGAENTFHEEVGYWLWDAENGQVLRCFVVPRGITIVAGGDATADATSFRLAAERGSTTYGITANRFLDREFRTVRFEETVTFDGFDTFSYREDTELELPGRDGTFHHTDENTLHRVD